jgi:MerR family transcriptional regulator, copper efflux regulator
MRRTKYFELAEARRDGLMNIGAAARASGVSAKMIRHYESMGLLPAASRTVAGYRVYRDTDVHTLIFVRRARDLGFSIKEIGRLLGLWSNQRRASADVKRLVQRHVTELDARIAALQSMRAALQQLARHCHGDARPECPILAEIAEPRRSAADGARGHSNRAANAAEAG